MQEPLSPIFFLFGAKSMKNKDCKSRFFAVLFSVLFLILFPHLENKNSPVFKKAVPYCLFRLSGFGWKLPGFRGSVPYCLFRRVYLPHSGGPGRAPAGLAGKYIGECLERRGPSGTGMPAVFYFLKGAIPLFCHRGNLVPAFCGSAWAVVENANKNVGDE